MIWLPVSAWLLGPMSTRCCSPNALERPRARPLALLAALLLALPACMSSAEKRQLIQDADLSWRTAIAEDSHEDTLELLRDLREDEGAEAMATVSFALKLVLESPSSLLRAEALRTAWVLAGPLEAEPPRASDQDYEGLLDVLRELRAQRDLGSAADQERARELALSLCTQRFVPEQVHLAQMQAEIVTRPEEWRQLPAVVEVFAREGPAAVRHATSLVTWRAAGDRADVVREEAYRSIPRLHPDVGIVLAAEALQSELDGQRLLILLDGIAHHAPSLSDDVWSAFQDALVRLVPDVDLGVTRRLDELLEPRA